MGHVIVVLMTSALHLVALLLIFYHLVLDILIIFICLPQNAYKGGKLFIILKIYQN